MLRFSEGRTVNRGVEAHGSLSGDRSSAPQPAISACERAADRRLVSAIIPTRNRPGLVCRAVRSVLAQTYRYVEAVVVIDGPDERTEQALSALSDARLRTVRLPRSQGGATARNAGVRAAAGEWIAFLDDDDEWLEHKLQSQMDAAAHSPHRYPILCSQLIARSPLGDYVWPRRVPAPGEPLSEYLFARKGLFQGEGLIQSTMILVPRGLLLEVPFADGLPGHQDWDWILRAAKTEGTGIQFVPEPLAIWYIEEGRQSVSGELAWRHSLNWINQSRHLVTPRAYASFVMTSASARAAQNGTWSAFLPLLTHSLRYGRPKPIDFLVFLAIWLIPQPVRWRLRSLLGGKKRS
jgi:glycosyltransferase involved in cell wall biosynthesis